MTYGRLAQLVEHLLDVQEVTGSSPVPSTTKILRLSSEDFLFGGGTGREQGGSDDASRQSKQSAQCNDDDRSQRLKQGGVVGAAF